MRPMPPLFHIVPVAAWEAARASGEYRPPSLAAEGFIHLSTSAQWPLTAARFFKGQSALLLLEVDAAAVASQVRFEAADGDSFPHLYAPLSPSAVRAARPFRVDAQGVVLRDW
ncbi:MAG: DUF952 domain-containing protein [Myxococcus sp.]|nr:DUF952 domain-containing protein [Myxococcus sp.]